MSDELQIGPEDFEEVGLDPGLLDAPTGRKDFLFNTGKLMAAAAAAGPFFMAEKQARAAIRASTAPPGKSSASIAVAAAKKYKGTTLNRTVENTPQALDPINFSGPLWEKLTGIKLNVIQLPHPAQYSKPIAEHIAKSGAYDVLDIEPGWIPAMSAGGVIDALDSFVNKYDVKADLNDYHPLYKALGTFGGKRWGFFDDGDMFALYYRKDIFGDPKLQKAHKSKFGKPLAPPKSWDDYATTAQFLTDQLAPKVYGTSNFRKQGAPGNQFGFLQEYRANGGVLFDVKTMKAQLNSPPGVKTLQQFAAQDKASLPGYKDLDAVSEWVAWLQGKLAMIYSWPPTGRISENYSQRSKAFNFLPKSKIVGKVGYAVMPGGHGEMASGYAQALSSDSKNKEAAYLFMQWNTSPEISLQRVMLPYALRDPYRLSHFKSKKYRALWPAAKEYLINLNNAANGGVLDMIMPGWQDYALSLDRMVSAASTGTSPEKALSTAASEWDAITKKLGVDKQRTAYQNYSKLPGSSAKNTIAARGQAVHLT